MEFNGGVGSPNFKLMFPYQSNSDFVFLVEVTFLNEAYATFDASQTEIV